MANYFVDSGTGSDSDAGTDFDLAWATVEHAYEAGGLSAGDFIFTEPSHFEIPTTDIAPIYDGAANDFIHIVAWPKPAFSITSATWTNGSTTVDLVLPATLTRTGHVGRMVTAPDGNDYFITYITDSNTFTIDREYAGSTVTLTDGAATIKADPFYTEAQAIDDSAWTIKKTDWNANNPARPIIDFNDGDFQLYFNSKNHWWVQGFEFKDSSDDLGIILLNFSDIYIRGCILKQSASNDSLMNTGKNQPILEECIFEGSGAGSAQNGIESVRWGTDIGMLIIKNSAIYNCGNYGISNTRRLYLDNVNIGIEQTNGNEDIDNSGMIRGKDVRLGGTNGYVNMSASFGNIEAAFENYQKILGNHRALFIGGYYEEVAVSGETPNKKLSDEIIKITPNVSGYEFIPEMAFCIFEDEWNNVPAGTYNIGYWIYNDSGVTLNVSDPKLNIWLEVEYLAGYDDTSEYVMAKTYSTLQDIADAADADDWDKLVTGNFTTAATSKIRAKIYFSKYLASTNVFIDTEETEN